MVCIGYYESSLETDAVGTKGEQYNERTQPMSLDALVQVVCIGYYESSLETDAVGSNELFASRCVTPPQLSSIQIMQLSRT